jgi:hypothetical protein
VARSALILTVVVFFGAFVVLMLLIDCLQPAVEGRSKNHCWKCRKAGTNVLTEGSPEFLLHRISLCGLSVILQSVCSKEASLCSLIKPLCLASQLTAISQMDLSSEQVRGFHEEGERGR